MVARHRTVDKKQTVEANRSQRRYWMQNRPSVADAGAAKPIVTATISDAVKRASPGIDGLQNRHGKERQLPDSAEQAVDLCVLPGRAAEQERPKRVESAIQHKREGQHPSSDKNSCVLKSDMNASNAMHGTASFQTTVVSACLSPGPRMSARNSAQPAAIRITV